MADVEPQTAVEPSIQGPEKADLLVRLDGLLEAYLNTLDQYQKACQQLSSQLSSGFLSLAQANFNNQSRTRYGQDYYDDRMTAIRKVSSDLTVQEDDAVLFQVASAEKGAEAMGPGSKAADEAEGLSTEPHNAESESIDETTETKRATNNNTSTDSKATRDPLRWFGILVPSSLRSAQSTFVSAVDGAIPELATLGDSLRKQEIAIQRLRKQIRKS